MASYSASEAEGTKLGTDAMARRTEGRNGKGRMTNGHEPSFSKPSSHLCPPENALLLGPELVYSEGGGPWREQEPRAAIVHCSVCRSVA